MCVLFILHAIITLQEGSAFQEHSTAVIVTLSAAERMELMQQLKQQERDSLFQSNARCCQQRRCHLMQHDS